MPESLEDRLALELEQLRSKDRYRSVRRSEGVNFGSNDYLGFAVDPSLQARARQAMESLPLSASSSRLLPGYHAEHSVLEEAFSQLVASESALYFGSGYAANLALLTSLTSRHDLIVYDELVHASWYDAAHASYATAVRFRHNSLEDLEAKLQQSQPDHGHTFVVIESVYSMDGDTAPIEAIAKVAERIGATLIVDEAHATGVVGPRGAGLSSALRSSFENIISVHTCGKALGSAGALVASSAIVRDYLINKARPFIFSTALPPLIALQVLHAVELLQDRGDEMIDALRSRAGTLREVLRNGLRTWRVPEGSTPIIPIIIGEERNALVVSRLLRDAGFEVPAIRPPSVPVGTSRLRLNVSLGHSETELHAVAGAILRAESELAP